GLVYVAATLLLLPGWIFPLAAGAIFGLGWVSLVALTCVDLASYMGGTMAGMLPVVLLTVWLGAAGRDVMTHGGPLQWTMLGAEIAATLIVSYLVTRLTRARLKLAR